MHKGPSMRTRKSQKRYIQGGLGSHNCPFCDTKHTKSHEIYEETNHFYRIENLFGYDIWDDCVVSEHQMIIPKRHIVSLSEFTPAEDGEYIQLVKQAEASGYNIYSRAKQNATRSIAHQHTHLIKFKNDTEVTKILYLKKPHMLVYGTKRT